MKYFIFFSIISACTFTTATPVVVEPVDSDQCPEACTKLRDLKCEEGQSLPDGTSCEDFCRHSQEMGHALQPACIINRVHSCDDMFDLETTCLGFTDVK
jgi:hypothetical protein